MKNNCIDVSGSKFIDRLQNDLGSKCNVIRSIELAHNTLRDLITNKDELIQSQKTIIEGIQKDVETLNERDNAEDIIASKDLQLEKCKNEIVSLRRNSTSTSNHELEELRRQLELEKQINQDMVKKLEDQTVIGNKTELAFDAKTELVNSKNEIIETFKSIVEQYKKEPCRCKKVPENGMTSDTICGNTERSDEQEMKTKKGVKECNEFLEVYATNDAILNGLLLWINIQRHVTPENIWKTQAVTKFLKEEITDAKEILWRIIGESELGKMKKRQGTTKTISEINDICYALNVLSEKDRLPIFLSTSDMVSQTPIYISHPVEGDSSEINARLRVIEESLNSIIASSSSKNESTESAPASSTAVVNANITNEGDQNQTECLSDVAAVRKTWADITVQKYKNYLLQNPAMTSRKIMAGLRFRKNPIKIK